MKKSGCGKSTLMRLLLLHYQSTEGSIIDNILFESSKSESDPTVKEIINRCGLIEVLNTFPSGIYSRISEGGIELSSGQKQRII